MKKGLLVRMALQPQERSLPPPSADEPADEPALSEYKISFNSLEKKKKKKNFSWKNSGSLVFVYAVLKVVIWFAGLLAQNKTQRA